MLLYKPRDFVPSRRRQGMHDSTGNILFETLADAALGLLSAGLRVHYLAISSLVWVLYDYCLTLEQEVSCHIVHRLSASAHLYFW